MTKIRNSKSIIALFIIATMLCSLLPHITIVARGATQDEFITAVNGEIAAIAPTCADTETNTDLVWKDHLNDQFYAAVGQDAASLKLKWNLSSGVANDWKWSGNTATDTPADSTAKPLSSTAIPYHDTLTDTYYVWSGEQLRYAIDACKTVGGNIEIKSDLDLNGQNNADWQSAIFTNGTSAAPIKTVINGNGNTIYNLMSLDDCSTSTDYAALIGVTPLWTDITIQDLNFENMNLCGTKKTTTGGVTAFVAPNTDGAYNHAVGIIGRSGSYRSSFSNVHVKNGLLVGGSYVGTLFGRFDNSGTTAVANQNHTVIKCTSENVVAAGAFHVGALGGSVTYMEECAYSFTVGSTVISTAGHSGGLFACMANVTSAHDCFADSSVYGTNQTGGFTGMMNNMRNSAGQDIKGVVNCYSSGFVEGQQQLGGFVGICSTTATFINCYSTSLVGMRSNGTKLGGFMGDAISGYQYSAFVNCYAAGEVGNADTDVTPSADTSAYVGGFVGFTKNNTRELYAYSYYDKQTTAMREWSNGVKQGALEKTVSGYAGQHILLGIEKDKQGLRGVLTTNTTKSGQGLVGTPAGTFVTDDGFTGFLPYDDFADTAKANILILPDGSTPDISWDYSAENHYPELSVFSKAKSENWGKYTQIVKDYSKSSTSAVLLETWEKTLNHATGILEENTSSNPLTYDTVRDLTIRFNLTGDSDDYSWYRTAQPTVDPKNGDGANTNGASVNILGNLTPVLNLSTKSNGSYNFYYGDQFSPGLEWLLVKYGNAERRLRVMPTAGIEAGISKTIYRPSDKAPNEIKKAAYYDHADDVELYFSTASRMAQDMNDVTTGIFPDASGGGVYSDDCMTRTANNLTDRQIKLMDNDSDADISDYFQGNSTDDKYGVSLDTDGKTKIYPGVDLSYMSRLKHNSVSALEKQNNSANGSKVYVYGRTVSGIASNNGEISVGDDLLDFTEASNFETYNGKALSIHEDQILLFEYVWELADGRVINDAKLITVRATPFDVKVNALDCGGLNGDVDSSNKAETDVNNGLVDTNDLLIDAKRFGGQLTDTQVKNEVDDPTTRSTDELLPYIDYPNTEDIDEDLRGTTVPDSLRGPEYTDTVVASWKLTNDEKTVTAVRIRMDSGRDDESGKKVYFTATVNPQLTNKIVVPYEYYRYITDDDGNFYVRTEHLDRTYEIKQKGDVFYIAFNHNDQGETDLGYDVDVVDVANNIEVDIETSSTLTCTKTVVGDYADANMEFEFGIDLDDGTGTNDVTYDYYILHRDNSRDTGTVKNGTNTFNLMHGDTINIMGLPYGATYVLTENDYSSEAYMTMVDSAPNRYVSGSMTVLSKLGESESNADYTSNRSHSFLNSKYLPPVTGVSIDMSWAVVMVASSMIMLLWIVHTIIRKKKYDEE